MASVKAEPASSDSGFSVHGNPDESDDSDSGFSVHHEDAVRPPRAKRARVRPPLAVASTKSICVMLVADCSLCTSVCLMDTLARSNDVAPHYDGILGCVALCYLSWQLRRNDEQPPHDHVMMMQEEACRRRRRAEQVGFWIIKLTVCMNWTLFCSRTE